MLQLQCKLVAELLEEQAYNQSDGVPLMNFQEL